MKLRISLSMEYTYLLKRYFLSKHKRLKDHMIFEGYTISMADSVIVDSACDWQIAPSMPFRAQAPASTGYCL
jgi:hypothetical protein